MRQNRPMGDTRGKTKIKQAAEVFDFDFRGKAVLDIGSSTGGFSEYALERGAEKVIAVEKGTNQMMAPLRFESKIELHEKTDIFDVAALSRGATRRFDGAGDDKIRKDKSGKIGGGQKIEVPDVILADVSFVSLKKILLHAKENIAGPRTEFLVMLKPQFEARPAQLWNGVVKNEKMRREVIKEFEQFLRQKGFLILKKHDNELTGKTGNRERFYLLTLSK